MIEELLMGLGALISTIGIIIWTVGELIAFDKGEDTTTSYVKRGRRKRRYIKILVYAGTTGFVLFADWLWIHFNTPYL